jgi:hypothetical protein
MHSEDLFYYNLMERSYAAIDFFLLALGSNIFCTYSHAFGELGAITWTFA